MTKKTSVPLKWGVARQVACLSVIKACVEQAALFDQLITEELYTTAKHHPRTLAWPKLKIQI